MTAALTVLYVLGSIAAVVAVVVAAVHIEWKS